MTATGGPPPGCLLHSKQGAHSMHRDPASRWSLRPATALLGLALLAPRLVRRGGRDPLGDLVRTAASLLASLDVLVLTLALSALDTARGHRKPPRKSYLFAHSDRKIRTTPPLRR